MNVIMTAPGLAPEAVALIEAAGGTIHFMRSYPTAAEVAALAGQVDAVAILSRQGPVTAAAMDAAPRLRIVARHGVGVDDVDLAEAARRGILVTRAPGSNTRAVAEHTVAVILALAKQLRPLGAAIAAGGWRGAETPRDIAGLRLGLLGCGAIGSAVAALAAPLGMAVRAWTRSTVPAGITRAESLGDLLANSDVLSLHLPYTPQTRHLIGAAQLAALPSGAFLVNTSRGGLVDEDALRAALDAGHLAGAALDVFETEPPAAADPLRDHPRILVTPHASGGTPGALRAMGTMAAESIAAVLRGEAPPPDHVVRP